MSSQLARSGGWLKGDKTQVNETLGVSVQSPQIRLWLVSSAPAAVNYIDVVTSFGRILP